MEIRSFFLRSIKAENQYIWFRCGLYVVCDPPPPCYAAVWSVLSPAVNRYSPASCERSVFNWTLEACKSCDSHLCAAYCFEKWSKCRELVGSCETDSKPNNNLYESSSQFSEGQESCPLSASKRELMKPEVAAVWERLSVGSIIVAWNPQQTN